MKPLLPLLAAMASLACAAAGLPCVAHAGEITVVTTRIDNCDYMRGVFGPYAYGVAVSAAGYPDCIRPVAGYYAYSYAWGNPWLYPYYPYASAYAPRAFYGVAYGPAGVAAWGPFGGVAATTGTVTYQHANGWGAYRASTFYDPWTGNSAAQRSKAVYDAGTGTYAAGQRGAAYNSYTGNYGYGERGAAYNGRTGAAAAGGHVTVGNAATGKELQAARGVAYDPVTGQAVRASGVRGENGGVARVNNRVFVSRDGNVRQVTPRRSAGQRRTAPRR
jgi:hypothetical protein